jgi:hypothetical protein
VRRASESIVPAAKSIARLDSAACKPYVGGVSLALNNSECQASEI